LSKRTKPLSGATQKKNWFVMKLAPEKTFACTTLQALKQGNG
jgi:hypothetical protein